MKRSPESGQTGGASQLMDSGGDVDAHQLAGLCKERNRAIPEET